MIRKSISDEEFINKIFQERFEEVSYDIENTEEVQNAAERFKKVDDDMRFILSTFNMRKLYDDYESAVDYRELVENKQYYRKGFADAIKVMRMMGGEKSA